MRKLLKGHGRAPRVMVTDKLRSYDAAKREIMPRVEHRSHKGLAENSRQPINQAARTVHEMLQVEATFATLRLHP